MAADYTYSPDISIGRANQYISPYGGLATPTINWSDLVNSTSVGRFTTLQVLPKVKSVPHPMNSIRPVSLPQYIIDQQASALMLAEEMDKEYSDPIDQLARLLEDIEADGETWRDIIDDQHD
jgi:hypothetical protein